MMQADQLELAAHYDALWRGAVEGFEREGVQTDPHLPRREGDRRRGLTLIARPAPEVRERVLRFLEHMEAVAPGQYRYTPAALHVTVLALFTATAQVEPYYARLALYQDAVQQALRDARLFAISFRGITASQSVIMVQGFPHTDELNRLRDALRGTLRELGLGADLDTRYRLRTAHLTALRFQRQPRDIPALLDALRAYREHDFGVTTVETLQLVKNDWYMSPDRVELVAEHRLR